MKKVIIFTIQDVNYGNRLQNYAMQEILRANNFEVLTFGSDEECFCFFLNNGCNIIHFIKKIIKIVLTFIPGNRYYKSRKLHSSHMMVRNEFLVKNGSQFREFNSHINFTKQLKSDYFVCGSDQIWNPNFYPRQKKYMLGFSKEKQRNVAIAPSIAIDSLSYKQIKEFNKYIHNFSALSCREIDGSLIIESIFHEKCETLIDPTLMLSRDEWLSIAKKPKMFSSRKYLLIYFLGDISSSRKLYIDKIANDNCLEIINMMDYVSGIGPSEFIYLIKESTLFFTDSFHALVFSYIFNINVRVLNREQKGLVSMNSRMDSLKKTLLLDNKIFIDDEKLANFDSTPIIFSYDELEKQQKKFQQFIKTSMKN